MRWVFPLCVFAELAATSSFVWKQPHQSRLQLAAVTVPPHVGYQPHAEEELKPPSIPKLYLEQPIAPTTSLDGLPTLQELYEATVVMRETMDEKERIFADVVERLQADAQTAQRALEDAQRRYNDEQSRYQQETEQAKRQLQEQQQEWQGRMQQSQSLAQQRQQEAADQIQRLTQELQQLQRQAQQGQLVAVQEAQARQAELMARVQELEAQLAEQVAAGQSARVRSVDDELQQRRQHEQELNNLRQSYASTITDLEQRLAAEQRALSQERQRAQEEMERVRRASQQQVAEAMVEAKQLRQALLDGLQARDDQYGRTVQQLTEAAALREQELTRQLESVNSELQNQRSVAQQKLEDERATAKRHQDEMLAQLEEKQRQLQALAAKTAEQQGQLDELSKRRSELEGELSTLQRQYNSELSAWNARSRALEDELARVKQDTERRLEQARQETQQQIDASKRLVEERKMDMESGFRAKEIRLTDSLTQMEHSAEAKVRELQEWLQSIGEELRRTKLEADQNLADEKRLADESKSRLMSEIEAKEQALRNQIDALKAEQARSEGLRQKQVDLEQRLATILQHSAQIVSSWDAFSQSLSESQVKRNEAAARFIAEKGKETEAKIAYAMEEADRSKALLKAALASNESQYKRSVDELLNACAEKENELKAALDHVSNNLQQTKLELNQKLMEEQHAALRRQDAVLAKILDNEKRLEEAAAAAARQKHEGEHQQRQRTELESELVSLQRKYEDAMASWDQRYQELEKIRRREQIQHEAALAAKEAEALETLVTAQARAAKERTVLESQIATLKETNTQQRRVSEALVASKEKKVQSEIATVVHEAEKKEATLKEALQSKEREYQQAIEKLLRAATDKDKALAAELRTMTTDLHKLKIESRRKFDTEKQTALGHQSKLLAQINEMERRLQATLAESARNKSQAEDQSKRRQQLEAELSALRLDYNSVVKSWDQRYRELDDVRKRELMQYEASLAAKEAEAVEQLGKARTIAAANEHSRLQSRTSELEAHYQSKLERLTEINKVLQARTEEVKRSRDELEQHLSLAVRNAAETVSSWEGLSKSISEAHIRQKEMMQSLVSRTALEAEAKVAAAVEDAERSRAELASALESKDAQHKLAMEQLREASARKENELAAAVKSITHDLERLKLESDLKSRTDQQAAHDQQASLLARISETENRLVELSQSSGGRLSKVRNESKLRSVLEAELAALKRTYETTFASWERRTQELEASHQSVLSERDTILAEKESHLRQHLEAVKANALLEQSRLKEKMSVLESQHQANVENIRRLLVQKEKELESTIDKLKELLHAEQESRRRNEQLAASRLASEQAAAQQRIDEAVADALRKESTLSTQIKANDEEHDRLIRQIRTSAEQREQQLLGQVDALRDELDKVKLASQQQLAAANDSSHQLQRDMETRMADMKRQLDQQASQTAAESSRAEETLRLRMELEQELDSLRRQHETMITDWKTRYDAMESAQLKEQQALQESLERAQAEARVQIEAARIKAEEHRVALANGLREKETTFTRAMNQLRDSSADRERELAAKIQAMKDELDRNKLETLSRLLEEKELAMTKQGELIGRIELLEYQLTSARGRGGPYRHFKFEDLPNIQEHECVDDDDEGCVPG